MGFILTHTTIQVDGNQSFGETKKGIVKGKSCAHIDLVTNLGGLKDTEYIIELQNTTGKVIINIECQLVNTSFL